MLQPLPHGQALGLRAIVAEPPSNKFATGAMRDSPLARAGTTGVRRDSDGPSKFEGSGNDPTVTRSPLLGLFRTQNAENDKRAYCRHGSTGAACYRRARSKAIRVLKEMLAGREFRYRLARCLTATTKL